MKLLTHAVTCACAFAALAPVSTNADLPQTIERVKPAVVAIGTFIKTRSPSSVFVGTGFAVADGRHVVTNAHVVSRSLDTEKKETYVVLVASDNEPREAQLLAVDKDHDLALLKIAGDALPALKIGDSAAVHEGQQVAFTGFPLALAFGFHPATHRATIASITPVAMPGMSARQLSSRMVARMRETTYTVFQLDGTAYPGNSGSALYDPESGAVVGIINMVFVRGTRESAISNPSGISYAIPSAYIADLLRDNGLAP